MLDKDLKLLFFANLVGSFGDGLYAYLLPYYLKDSLSATPVQVGLLYAATNVCAALTLLVSGIFGDRYDRKRLLILGWFFWLPTPIIFAFAQNWLSMLPGMVFWGFFLGPPVSAAYVVGVARKENLTLTMATISSAFSLGYVTSPALGGYIAGTSNMTLVFFLAFFFYLVAGLTLVFIRSQIPNDNARETNEGMDSRRGLLGNRRLVLLSVLLGFIMFTFYLFRPFVPTFLSDIYRYGSFEIGLLGSFTFLGSAVLSVGLGRLGDKKKKSHAMIAALGFVAFALLLLVLFGDLRVLIVTHFLIGASFLSWPLTGAIVGSQAPESARAFSVAIPMVIGMTGAISAPYLGGVLYELSPFYPFYLGICVVVTLMGFALAKLD